MAYYGVKGTSMTLIRNSLKANILGTTSSGKYIHKEPTKNVGFKKQDHLEAYKAHATYLMNNELVQPVAEKHRLAMNEHYLKGCQ